MTSSGDPIASRIILAHVTPIIANIKPKTIASSMAECTVSWVSLSLCEAIKRATSTLTPTDKPINKLTNRLTTEDVEPTAAIERGPANCPTTITSAALNNNCSTPENINGIENIKILPSNGPCVISI